MINFHKEFLLSFLSLGKTIGAGLITIDLVGVIVIFTYSSSFTHYLFVIKVVYTTMSLLFIYLLVLISVLFFLGRHLSYLIFPPIKSNFLRVHSLALSFISCTRANMCTFQFSKPLFVLIIKYIRLVSTSAFFALKSLSYTFFKKVLNNYKNIAIIIFLGIIYIFGDIINIYNISYDICVIALISKKNILTYMVLYPYIIKRFSQGGGKGLKEVGKVAKKVIPTEVTITTPSVQQYPLNYKSPNQTRNNTNNNNASNQITQNPTIFPSNEPKNLIAPVNADIVGEEIDNIIKRVFKEDIEKLGFSKDEIRSRLLDSWKKDPANYKENINKLTEEYLAAIHKKEEESMASNFNVNPIDNTNTTSSYTSTISESTVEDQQKTSLSEKIREGASKIEGLTEFLKIKPNQLSKINEEMNMAHKDLGDFIKKFCIDDSKELTSFFNKENLQEYKKIFSEGIENLSPEQKYTHDAILGTILELKTREQLHTNIETIKNIKNSIDKDLLLTHKQLIEIAKKLSLVEYRDVSYTGKIGDAYELVEHKQKKVGQLVIKSRTIFEKNEKEYPDINRDEILKLITEKKFHALDINIKDPKYDKLFIPSGVTGHTCIAINYKNKFLILGYLTSETDCPQICDYQLFNQEKSQHLYLLPNFCIEETNTTISNIQIKEYLDISKTLDKIVEVIADSESFAQAINKPTMDTPITTFENVKNLVVEKADSLLLTFQKKPKQYPEESSIIKKKEENKKVKFFLNYLKNHLDDNAKQLLNWYLETEKQKNNLADLEMQVIQSLNKEKYKNNVDNHE